MALHKRRAKFDVIEVASLVLFKQRSPRHQDHDYPPYGIPRVLSKRSREFCEFLNLETELTSMESGCRLDEERFKERIKSAINKGKQTSLASYSKGISLSKFEHNGNDGPLVVFAEELSYPFGLFANYKLVRSYIKPNDAKNTFTNRTTPGKKQQEKISKPRKGLMLDGKKRGNVVNAGSLTEKSGFEVHNSLKKELRLPKLRSSSMRQERNYRGKQFKSRDPVSKNSEFSTENTELPQLPAQHYIDNFRRDAAEFERKLSVGFSRANTDKRMFKAGRTRDSLLPKIDEKMTVFATPSTTHDKPLSKDDHIRLPKLKETHDSVEILSRKKRKQARSEEVKRTTRQDAKRSTMSHSERKAAAQREHAKWCRKTMQSDFYI